MNEVPTVIGVASAMMAHGTKSRRAGTAPTEGLHTNNQLWERALGNGIPKPHQCLLSVYLVPGTKPGASNTTQLLPSRTRQPGASGKYL